MLELQGLSHTIADFVLKAELALKPGERLVIQAASGAGKSTLLSLIAGLIPLEQGTIRLNQKDITRLEPPRRDIGLVFQEPALFPSLNVIDNAAFGLKMRGVPKEQRHAQAREWLQAVGLAERAQDSVHPLSGGEKQRLAFVRALIWGPKLALLDEPFSALDPAMRAGLRGVLKTLHDKNPVPLILVSHDSEDVAALATARATITHEPHGIRRLVPG